MNQQKATTPLDYEHNPMLQTNNLHLHNKQHLLRTRKTFQNHSVFSQVGWLKPFSSRLHPCSREAGNSDCVSESFKSLTILLISCCVMRGGDIDVSGKKTIGILAHYTGCSSMPVIWQALLFFVINDPVTWGFEMGNPSWGTGRFAKGKFWYWMPRFDFTEKPFTLVKQK